MTDRNLNGHGLKDIIIFCQFSMVKCDLDADFEHYYDINYGNCFRFNSGFDSNGNKVDLEKSYLSGFYYGLQLTLYVNVYEKLIVYTIIIFLSIYIYIYVKI